MYPASPQGHADLCLSMGVWHGSSPLRISLGMESRLTTGGCCQPVVPATGRDSARSLPKSPFHLFLPPVSGLSRRPCPDLRPGFLRVRGSDLQPGAMGTVQPGADCVVCSCPLCGLVRAVPMAGGDSGN